MTHRSRLVAALASIAVVGAGLLGGVRVAGGADSFGYVSQAHMWAAGTLAVEQPLTAELTDLVPRVALAPLGYRPDPRGPANVPIYSPGLPMLMAAFERAAGPRAVFVVVPLLGGLAVWATFIMGRRLANDRVGAAAAVLLASNPSVLSQLMFPESDVPIMMWWAVCLALLARAGKGAAFAAGLAAGCAILTRPNLVPVAIVPGAWLLWTAASSRTRHAASRVALFGLAALPACLVVAALNARWYGSPLLSGYGTLEELFAWSSLGPNLARYPKWIVDSLTPLVLLAPLAPLFVSDRGQRRDDEPGKRGLAMMWLLFAGAVTACYLFYLPWDDPGFVRFLLPAFPPLVVLAAAVLVTLSARLPTRLAIVVPLIVVGLIAMRGGVRAYEQNIVHQRVETRYAIVGEYLSAHLPERAVLLAMQHSGSARYYSGRITIRYDVIPPGNIEPLLARLRQLGYEPYVLLDEGEESAFRDRFSAHSPIGALDWAPMAQLRSPRVNLYATAPEVVSGASLPRVTSPIRD